MSLYLTSYEKLTFSRLIVDELFSKMEQVSVQLTY